MSIPHPPLSLISPPPSPHFSIFYPLGPPYSLSISCLAYPYFDLLLLLFPPLASTLSPLLIPLNLPPCLPSIFPLPTHLFPRACPLSVLLAHPPLSSALPPCPLPPVLLSPPCHPFSLLTSALFPGPPLYPPSFPLLYPPTCPPLSNLPSSRPPCLISVKE
ncbi:unnamed protein product [Closterium sp. NIES-53]